VNMEQLFDLIHPDDQNGVEEFEAEAKDFFESLHVKEKWNYKTCYNFRIRTKYGRFKHILFQSVPYRFTEDNETEHLGIFTNIDSLKSNSDQHLSFIHLNGGSSYQPYKTIQKVGSFPPLSRRELEIMTCMMKGFDVVNTAQKLNISLSTLRNHLKHIRNKTGAKSTIHLVALAKERNWIK
ncbi:MAG: helix-turn-helix transcriptional regulator, partial [Cryomorphaceae bacterium]